MRTIFLAAALASASLGTAMAADLPGPVPTEVHREHAYRAMPRLYPYVDPVEVGAILPRSIPLQGVPARYGILDYKYAVVNGKPIIVDPRTREIVLLLTEQ